MPRSTTPSTHLICILVCVGAPTSACTEQELVTSVVVVDPLDGTELERRSRPGESLRVRTAAMPAGVDDVLAWGAGNFLELRYQGEWEAVDLAVAEFTFGPVSGQAPPEIYGIAGYEAFVWSTENGTKVAQAETHPLPFDVIAADWDGDGTTDLIASSPQDGIWFHARGPDGLAEIDPIVEGVGGDQHIAVGDFDQDGRMDVVRPDSRDVEFGFGETEGFIDEVITFPRRVDDVDEVAVGDITGDGLLDVVIAGRDGIEVIENGGGRSFTAGSYFPEMNSQMELMDVDGDGDLDIVGQPPPPSTESWGKELLIARNEDGVLSDPEPLFDSPEWVVDLAAGTDEDGTPWLAMSTFTYREVRAELERR